MKFSTLLALGLAAGALVSATAALAGAPGPGGIGIVGAPSPLLGAGLPGLAVMAAAGAGYVAMRLRRRGRD